MTVKFEENNRLWLVNDYDWSIS